MNARLFLVLALFVAGAFSAGCSSTTEDGSRSTEPLSLGEWSYINVDDERGKWGDYDDPGWLKYLGLDMADMNGDDQKDIVSGRYVYLNPGSDMSGSWQRIDLGLNVDGMLVTDVDGDDRADVIGTALPSVYWMEAESAAAERWTGTEVAQLQETGHVNGQGFALGQVVAGGKPEILLSAGDGIHYLEIPSDPSEESWPTTQIAPTAFDEGLSVGDIDGDGDLDLTAWYEREGGEVVPGTNDVAWESSMVAWWENPDDGTGQWTRHDIGIATQADRFRMADINGDGRFDVVTSEERYPGDEPNASLYWFEAPADPADGSWRRHNVLTTYSLNSLDAADMDRDGDPDIVTNEHKGPDLRTLIFENDGQGRFTQHVVGRGKEAHLGAQTADLDGDGDLDIVSHAWDAHQDLHLWRNDAVSPAMSSE